MIIEHVAGYGAEALITAPETLVSEDHQRQIKEIIKRRELGEPLTRILGVREFWGLEFEVTPDVLDPRADTEILVESALKWVKEQNIYCVRALDLGTGTGCIPIALLTELLDAQAMAIDKSSKALEVAKRNAQKHNVSDRIEFIQGDWFEGLKEQKFDLIVSNPPYISNEVIQNLDDEVKNHDPFMALSGGESGLDAYEIIISDLEKYLNGGGRAFLEIGYDQASSLQRLVDESNLLVNRVIKDLGGNDRVVEISKRPSGDK